MKFSILILLIVLSGIVQGFELNGYTQEVTIESNGDLHIVENINVYLDKPYNEGYRTIRKDDVDVEENLKIKSVQVNHEVVQFWVEEVEDGYEIVYDIRGKTGLQTITLEYVLSDQIMKYDDFALLCIEHYGAQWPVTLRQFKSITTPPLEAVGKEMHYEVFSLKKGSAWISGREIIIELKTVPSGNFIGACYLFDRNSVVAQEKAGSAFEWIREERRLNGLERAYGIVQAIEGVCAVLGIIPLILIGYFVVTRVKYKGTDILPPEEELPLLVKSLVERSSLEKSMDGNIIGATILEMINQGAVEIHEEEMDSLQSGAMNREKTRLRVRDAGKLKGYHVPLFELLFNGKSEIVLDEVVNLGMDNADEKARQINIGMEKFSGELQKEIKAKYGDISKKLREPNMVSETIMIVIAVIGLVSLGLLASLQADIPVLAWCAGTLVLATIIMPQEIRMRMYQPTLREKTLLWEEFKEGLKNSRISEYPPSAVAIWNKILVYATALGLAKKVKEHLKEVGSLTESMERLQNVSTKAVKYGRAYIDMRAVYYGSKNRSSYGGRSSGGWSSRGGSFGGRSGGGGFR